MKFQHPEVLYALLALAIPVLVHLFSFRRYKRVAFSNVQFLKEIKEQQASRTNLKERLILAARLLSLFFIIAAFAKPYFGNANASSGAAPQAVSIFVDNSYSMQTLNRDGSLLDEARRRAREILTAYQPNDRFQLLTQDFEGRQQRLLTADEFASAVDTVTLSAQSHTLQQIVNRQRSLLNLQPQAIKTSYIVSDFQRNIKGNKPLADSNLKLNFIQLKAAQLPNVAIDSVYMLTAAHRAGAVEKVVVKLHNYSDKEAQAVPVKLLINGVQKAVGSKNIGANTTRTDTLVFSGLQPGWQQAELLLQDNPVTFDNQFYFTFDVEKQLPVLLINGDSPDKYLTAAFNTDTFFKLNQKSTGTIDYAALGSYPVIILSNIKTITAGLAQQLKSYLSNGGSLVVFPADQADISSYKNLLQPLNTAWPSSLDNEPEKVSALNLQHPVFANTFEQLPQNPDLPVVKKHYQLAGPVDNPASHIMDLPGRQAFIAGYTSSKGKVYISSVPLNEDYSNLPRHALLLPLLFRMSLLALHDSPLYYTIGADEHVVVPPLKLAGNQLLKLTGNKQSFIPDLQQYNGNSNLYVADQIKKAGLYRLTKNDSLVSVIAFNNNRSESDLHYLTADELLKLAPEKSKLIEAEGKPLTPLLKEANNGLQLWKVCLILALIFIAAEIVLIRYFKTTGIS